MRLVPALTLAVAFVSSSVVDASRLTPPVLPLIVRNPYLSTWLQDARDAPWSSWPMFWTGEEIGFSVLATVGGSVFPLLGRPHDSLGDDDDYNISSPIYNGAQYDASTTNLTYTIYAKHKPSYVKISFLSPITPTSTVRQSIPAAYMTVYVSGEADINIYVDVNGQWVSGDRGQQVVWDLGNVLIDEKGEGLKTWKVRRRNEEMLTEIRDRAEWGTLHFSAPADVRHECGTSSLLRKRFSRTGTLQNAIDDRYRGIMEDEPVFAFSKSFNLSSNVSSTREQSVTFTIAHIQNPIVQYAAARGLTFMRPLWQSFFQNSVEKLLTFHFLDFRNAAKLAYKYSNQLAKDALRSGAEDYVDIVALSARQVMGATSFSGTPDNPILFLKEISSNGNFQTVDVIYPSFPFFLYTNPKWLAYLLEPLIEHQLSGQYPRDYSMHDLGAHFPNATGHADGYDEYMPVEECGDMLHMGLALANSLKYDKSEEESEWVTSGPSTHVAPENEHKFVLTVGTEAGVDFIDEPWQGGLMAKKKAGKWVDHSYKLWKQWTSYLIEFSLEPAWQLTTDDFAGWIALHSNLALKGIVGINAMSKLSELTGRDAEAKFYRNISSTYVGKWEEFALSRDKTHVKLAYDWYGSWTTLYSLYADSLLCFHLEDAAKDYEYVHPHGGQKPIKAPKNATGLIPRRVYQMSSDWYHAVRQKYGLPLDSRHLYTKTDWEFFAMAVAAPKVRADILQSVAKWVNETVTDRPLTDLHETEGYGEFPGPRFFARPVIGGHFAFLALEKACGGRASAGLEYLEDPRGVLDVESILAAEKQEPLTAWREL